MFLVEALKYNVPAFHEDRLTQVVSATFNESQGFQRLLLKFLRVPYRPGLRSRTQVANEEAPSRPDLIIFDDERPYILIESKVEARSDKAQQNRHARMLAVHCFLIVRDPVKQVHIGRRFKKVTWGDFFSFIISADRMERDSIDCFLIEKLISFGKECKMLMPDRIYKSDFESASALVTQLRLKSSPSHSFEKRNPCQSLDLMSLFLERALIRVKDDPFLGSKLRTFTRRLGVSSLYFPDVRSEIAKEKVLARRHELRLVSDLVVIQKEIRLKKSVGDFQYLYVRISFVPYYKNTEVSDLSFGQIKKIELKEIKYRAEVEAGLCNEERVSSELVTFDDKDDLEFSDFYDEALKRWKRKLA
jgi:hypothetical protein